MIIGSADTVDVFELVKLNNSNINLPWTTAETFHGVIKTQLFATVPGRLRYWSKMKPSVLNKRKIIIARYRFWLTITSGHSPLALHVQTMAVSPYDKNLYTETFDDCLQTALVHTHTQAQNVAPYGFPIGEDSADLRRMCKFQHILQRNGWWKTVADVACLYTNRC